MAAVNRIELKPGERKRHPYLDMVIGGRSLRDLLSPAGGLDFIPPFGWPGEAGRRLEEVAAARLLLNAEPDLPAGRCSLLVCPECADLGCGAVTAVIEREGDRIIWREFGFETDYDSNGPDLAAFEHVYGFTFDAIEYGRTFQKYMRS